MFRRVGLLLAVTGLAATLGMTTAVAQPAANQPRPTWLLMMPLMPNEPIPHGCIAAHPTLTPVTQNHVRVNLISATQVTCTPASGWTVVYDVLMAQEFAYGRWQNTETVAAIPADFVPQLWVRPYAPQRARAIYTLVHGTTILNVQEFSGVRSSY